MSWNVLSSSNRESRWSLEPAYLLVLVGPGGFEMHHDRHRHPLRWWLFESNIGENFVFDGSIKRRITGRLPKRNLADFSRGVGPDPHLYIHDCCTGFFMGTQHFGHATLHLSGIVAVLAAASSTFTSEAGATASTIARGKT